jgi:hypothetical protein
MRIRLAFLLCVSLFAAINAVSQVDVSERNARWREFNKNSFDKVNYSKTKLTRTRLSKLKEDETADDFALLRGVIFGKRGRVFKERSIQDYLENQAWYKPNQNFSNALLSPMERANLDLVRIIEAEKHSFVEPGDMRIWRQKQITDDNLRDYTGAELTILAAEIEAIHGKTFSEEWLQKYFDERYWYKRSARYDPAVLTDIER